MTSEKMTRQYGTWSSPITPAMVAGALRINDVQWAGDTLVWHENRGKQGVLVAQTGLDAPRDLTGDLSVRGHVGYGGGEFGACGERVVFVAADGRVYQQMLSGGPARALTPGFGGAAAPVIAPNQRWAAYVHTYENDDVLALVELDGKQWSRKLAQGTDFVMQPVWSPDSTRLAYIAWNDPQMPWDGTVLHLLTLDAAGQVTADEVLVGDTQTAIFQPAFSPDGNSLSYISDATGVGQLYLYDLTTKTHRQLTNTPEGDAQSAPVEHIVPAWVQGLRVYGWSRDGSSLYYLRSQAAIQQVWQYRLADESHHPVTALNRYTYLAQLAVSPVDDTLAVIAGGAQIPTRLLTWHPERGERIHRYTMPDILTADAYADTQAITWTGHDGEAVYGLYYPPHNPGFTGPGAPPLIVYIHGGPSSQSNTRFNPEFQYFTSRGFAVLAVNHRGSTGYGRAYLRKLDAQWGYYDVEDGKSGAEHLVQQGLADRAKLIVMGGSAGGFTTLQSLVDYPGFYRAGVCLYGVSNQFTLVQDTHKFEAAYSFSLLGYLPEAAEVYRRRSPIFHADKIRDALIVFQGEEDNVVPRVQSDEIVAALQRRGVPHEYHLYAGEGHGFRKPETIDAYLNATLRFLTQQVIYG